MASNKDLEFTLKFKNEAKQVLQQARRDLQALGKDAAKVAQQLRQMNSQTSGAGVAGGLNSSSLAAQKLQIAQQRLAQQQQALQISSQKLGQAQQALGLNSQALQLKQDRLALSQQRLAQQQAKFNQSTKVLGGAFGGLVGQFVPFTVAAAAFGTIHLADEFKLLQARVKNSTETTAEFKQAFSGLRDIARTTGAGLEPVVSIFQRLSFTRKEIKATTDEMLQFTDTVAKLGVISGASPDALKFGLTQLGQSLSSNIVRAEEFNSIMENIPAVGKAIADQLGVTTGQLRLLVVNGKLLSEDVFAALLNATEEVNSQFEQFPQTVGRAFQGFLLDIQSVIGGLDGATSTGEVLIATIYGIGKAIKAIGELIEGVANIFKAVFNGVVTTLGAAINGVLFGMEKIINAGIHGINLFRKESNKLNTIDISFAPTDFGTEVAADVEKNIKDAKAAFKQSGLTVGDALGLTDDDVKKAQTNGRKISQDYKKIAQQLQDGSGKKKRDPKETFLRDYDLEIEKLKEEAKYAGESTKVRERRLAILKVEQDAFKAGIKNFNPSEYIQAYDALIAAQNRVHTDFTAGLTAAIQEFQENAKGMGDLAQDVFKRASDGISDTLSGLVDGSITKLSDLREAVGNILKDIAGQIAKFVIQQSIINPILSSFGFGGLGGGGGTSIPGGIGGTSYLLNAKGNAFDQGKKVTMFAKGGILDRPTAFPIRGGTGIAGEAGKEGIVPLKRMSNGDLGVSAEGITSKTASGQFVFSPSYNITISDSGNAVTSQEKAAQANDLGKRIDQEVRKTVIEVITQQQRQGGLLAGGKVS